MHRLLELFPEHRGSAIFKAYCHVANTGETRIIEGVSVEGIVSRPIWLRLVIVSMGEEIAILSQDITQRKQTEAEIHRLAYFDSLTGLPNRRLLLERLHLAIANCRRFAKHGALVFLDLDHFKTLNDTRGHDVGDQLLVEIGRRLSESLRENDTVARLGGVHVRGSLMLEGLSGAAEEAAIQVGQVAEKIRTFLASAYEIAGGSYRCTASLGVTLFNGQESSVEAVLKQADLAMYRAKDSGRDAIRFFDPEMQTAMEERFALAVDLRSACSEGQLELHYQAWL